MVHIHNSQHNQKEIVQVQTNTVVFYGHPELFGEEKSKFESEEKKFSIVLKMEVCGLKKNIESNYFIQLSSCDLKLFCSVSE